ncbi:hypothetical protein BDV06DRAFT_227537 [Aspergillus oleicola]
MAISLKVSSLSKSSRGPMGLTKSPTWYQDLPTPVKTYFAFFAAQIADSSFTYKPSAAVASSDIDSDGESWDLGEEMMMSRGAERYQQESDID